MKFYFKPMPWLSIITLACFAFLIHLGNWQKDRLAWKTKILSDIDIASQSKPLTSLTELANIWQAQEPIEFRRIELSGKFLTPDLNNGEPFHMLGVDKGKFYWRLYQLFAADGKIIYIATKEYKDGHASPAALTGEKKIVGYVRKANPRGRFTPKNNIKANRWFSFNGSVDELDWSKAIIGATIITDYYIDMQSADSADKLPIKKLDLSNNHLNYMLTWYSFAFILIVIYVLLHKKAGRLGFNKSGK